MTDFVRSSSPFDAPTVLEEAYTPSEILGRDNELDEIHSVFQQIIDNDPTLNAFVYGPSGVGKTVSVQFKLVQLEDAAIRYDDIDVQSIWQNCDGHSTSYQVAIDLANQLLPPEKQLPSSGLSKYEVYDSLFEAINQLGTFDSKVTDHVVIVLDEVDNIGTNDDILYQIPRAQANDRLTSVKPTLIGISNDLTFKNDLSPKVVSSLCEREIVFSRYHADDLSEILSNRAKKAFIDDAVCRAVIEYCAALGARKGGDARYALDVLKNAGRHAKKDGRRELTIEDVEFARDQIEYDHVREALSELSDHELMTIAAIIKLSVEGYTPARRGTIYTVYRQIANRVLGDANVSRRVHEYLQDLTMLGLLSRTEVKAGPGKNYLEYQFDALTPDMAIEVLEEQSYPKCTGQDLLSTSLNENLPLT